MIFKRNTTTILLKCVNVYYVVKFNDFTFDVGKKN